MCHGGAVFWSPRKFREARAREAVCEREEMEEKLQKARAKKDREEAQLQRQIELEERRVKRLKLNEMRKLERAEKELTTHLYSGQGLSVIKKSDFFHLFWKAWTSTFNQVLIPRSFEATGISPLQPNVILQRFAKDTPEASDSSTISSSVYSGKDWLKIETLLRKVVRDETSKELRKISRSLHHISV
ncbi:DUF1682 domain containing protein [Pyrenophora tritici-repentis]|nr:DUF1682 domain containing protein [Pyrenophora tritici-repentis]